MGNESVTPNNFYGKLKPSIEMGAFIALDIAIDLHLANTVDTGNLYNSWHTNRKYIKNVCEIANVDEYNGFDLDNEEKSWILEELGEPPESSYNVYFITVFKEDGDERVVYIGKTDSKSSRFANGHLAALKLHNPRYSLYRKRVYFGTITFLSSNREYIPLEFITPFSESKKFLHEMEAILISHFKPEFNVKSENYQELVGLIVHMQNFTDESSFLDDYFVYG